MLDGHGRVPFSGVMNLLQRISYSFELLCIRSQVSYLGSHCTISEQEKPIKWFGG